MDSSSSNAFPDSSNKPEIVFDLAHTECLLKHHPIVPTRKLPDDCRELNSLLIDRSDASITDAQIFETFKEDAIGTSFRPQCKYLQLFFPDETTADSVLKQGPYSIHGRTLTLFPLKGKVPPPSHHQTGQCSHSEQGNRKEGHQGCHGPSHGNN